MHLPGGQARCGVLFCNPLFEERKSAQRVMVDCARALCNDGIAVMRFDYRGCGDSDGTFEDFLPDDWCMDIRLAYDLLTKRINSKSIGILGLRLGANFALKSFTDGVSPSFFVLWEPIADGVAYMDHELRRKLLREMVTHGKGHTSREDLTNNAVRGESFDLDGYPVTASLYEAIKNINLRDDLKADSGRLLLINITHDEKAAGAMLALREEMPTGGYSFEVVTEPPFWNRVGLTDCPKLIDRTREWIGSCASYESRTTDTI